MSIKLKDFKKFIQGWPEKKNIYWVTTDTTSYYLDLKEISKEEYKAYGLFNQAHEIFSNLKFNPTKMIDLDVKKLKETFTKCIGEIGYDILDNIVCPLAGIGSPIADLYIASINNHIMDEAIDIKVLRKIEERYKLEKEDLNQFSGNDPLIAIITYILDNTDYLAQAICEAKDDILKVKKKHQAHCKADKGFVCCCVTPNAMGSGKDVF